MQNLFCINMQLLHYLHGRIYAKVEKGSPSLTYTYRAFINIIYIVYVTSTNFYGNLGKRSDDVRCPADTNAVERKNQDSEDKYLTSPRVQ